MIIYSKNSELLSTTLSMVSAIKQIFRSPAKKLQSKKLFATKLSKSSTQILKEINTQVGKTVDKGLREQLWTNPASIIGKPGSIVAIEIELNGLSGTNLPKIFARKANLTELDLEQKLTTHAGLDFETTIFNRTFAEMIANHGLKDNFQDPSKNQSIYVYYVAQNGEVKKHKIKPSNVTRNNEEVIAIPLFWHELGHVLLQLIDPESGPRYLNTIRVPEFSVGGFELVDETLARLFEGHIYSCIGGFTKRKDYLDSLEQTYKMETPAIIGSGNRFSSSDAKKWANSTYEQETKLRRNTDLTNYIHDIIQPGLVSFSVIVCEEIREDSWSHSFELYEGATGLTSAGSKI